MDLEIIRPVSDVTKVLSALRSAERGVIRIREQEAGTQLVCRFVDAWALLDFWATPEGPVQCPWFTHRQLRSSEFHYFRGCPCCDVEMESDVASAFLREEAYSVLEDFIHDGYLPCSVRRPAASKSQMELPQLAGFVRSAEEEDAIDWRPYQALRRDR